MHVGSYAEGAGIHGLAESLLRSKFAMGKLAGKPTDVSYGVFASEATRYTLPSAQSIIWSKGSRAL